VTAGAATHKSQTSFLCTSSSVADYIKSTHTSLTADTLDAATTWKTHPRNWRQLHVTFTATTGRLLRLTVVIVNIYCNGNNKQLVQVPVQLFLLFFSCWVGQGLDLCGYGQKPLTSSCEYGSKPSRFIKFEALIVSNERTVACNSLLGNDIHNPWESQQFIRHCRLGMILGIRSWSYTHYVTNHSWILVTHESKYSTSLYGILFSGKCTKSHNFDADVDFVTPDFLGEQVQWRINSYITWQAVNSVLCFVCTGLYTQFFLFYFFYHSPIKNSF